MHLLGDERRRLVERLALKRDVVDVDVRVEHAVAAVERLLDIHEPAKLLYLKVSVDDCEEIIEKSIIGDEIIDRLIYQKDGISYPVQEKIPFYSNQTRIVLEDCGQIDAESIEEYIAYGGYSSLEKCLFDITEDEVIKIITESNLRGRGGAGFPAMRRRYSACCCGVVTAWIMGGPFLLLFL